MVFKVLDADWQFSLSPDSIRAMQKHAQRTPFQKETAGQLFTRDLTGSTVLIDKATVLARGRATRVAVTIDPGEAMSQRFELFAQGHHCIGLWHTHPAAACEPSVQDERLAADHALSAKTVLNGLIFIIVGERPFPSGWYVALHDGERFYRAYPISVVDGNKSSSLSKYV